MTPAPRPGSARHRGGVPFSAAFGVLARMIVMLLLCTGGLVWLSGEAAASPPGGPFTLQDGDGRQVTDRDFRGKYMLVYFGYTFCPDACPTTLNEVADALDRLGAKADHIQAIFITVDPKRDTPTVVKQYAAAFSPRLIGLTGSPEQIAQVAKAYGVYYAETRTGPGPNDYAIESQLRSVSDGPRRGVCCADPQRRGRHADSRRSRQADVVSYAGILRCKLRNYGLRTDRDDALVPWSALCKCEGTVRKSIRATARRGSRPCGFAGAMGDRRPPAAGEKHPWQ